MTNQSDRVTVEQLEDAYTNLGHAVDAMKRTVASSNGLAPKLVDTVSVSTAEMAAFLAVIEHRSFTKAADVLGMSQPGLSRQVQRIEKALGHRLIARTGNGASITPQGVSVHKWCTDTLLGLQDLTAHRIEQTASAGAQK